ncbi:MAG: alpha/beta hydrolase [Thermoprotei archaeon]|nr:MAG: alpha/beta hydrolase [Thermoprotei archaeon]RLF19432.1 MAG: alpha/beta hydrolase [Thermoprotei archaeon]
MKCLEEPHVFESHGYSLSAYLHIPQTERIPPIVILFHGFTGNKIESGRLYVDLSRELCKEGVAVMRFDYRGHGDSPLNFEDFRIKWAFEDAEEAIKHVVESLRARVDVSRIGIVGLSLGGAVAIRVATLFKNHIKAMVLLSPAIDFSEIIKAEAMVTDNEYVYLGSQRIRRSSLEEMRSVNLMDRAEEIETAVLIIHSKDDQIVPYTQSLKFHERLKCTKKLILLNEGGHVFNTYSSRRRVIEEILKWFRTHLVGNSDKDLNEK